jgi:hypothetical protein
MMGEADIDVDESPQVLEGTITLKIKTKQYSTVRKRSQFLLFEKYIDT